MSEEEVKSEKTVTTDDASAEQPVVQEEDKSNIVAHLDKADVAALQHQKLLAEKALSDARIAELEYRSLIQHVFLKYELKMTDRIDDATGVVTRDR